MSLSIKGVDAVHADMTVSGKICIEQWSHEFGETVCIYLTLDQFREIEHWVDRNEVDIEEAWNSGVENETDS